MGRHKRSGRKIRWTRVLVALELLNGFLDLVLKFVDLARHLIEAFF